MISSKDAEKLLDKIEEPFKIKTVISVVIRKHVHAC